MRQLIWSELAAAELFQIADSYDGVDPELPDQLLDRIIAAPRPLLEHPQMGNPFGLRGLRKWPVKNTPSLQIYTHRGGDTVEIVRVRHAREDWRRE